jgi:hypothetical protein
MRSTSTPHALSDKENFLRVIRHDKPEWVPNGLESVMTIQSPAVERPAIESCDCFGVHWSLEEEAEGGTYPTLGMQPITDLRKWKDQITIPDVNDFDWTPVAGQARQIDRSENLISGFSIAGLFERSYMLLGMEEALIHYITEPELMCEMLGAIADYKIALIDRFTKEADLDIMLYGDDWGTQSNLFISPDIWRRVIKPHTKRIYDSMKHLGLIINQHSCGKIESVFGDMVEMGADIYNPCQPCNDLELLKRQFTGKITFCGGIDSQFVLDRPGVTPEEVRAEVRLRIDQMADGGGYIASPSQSVPYDKVLLDAMNDEISAYGKAFYKH